MAVAARVDPKTFFAPDQWARLTARSNVRGLWLIAHAWGVIGLAVAMAVVWPLTIPLAVMIIGGRQLGLAILMHDAAHGALARDLKLNDWLGEHLTAGGLHKYRPYHLQHHKYAQQAEDPDLVLSAPFPITGRSLRRKIARDLTGRTWLKLRWGQVAAELKARKAGETVWPILMRELKRKRRFFIGGLATTAVFAPFGYWWVWPVLWVLPAATWLQMITRLRNIAEHACIRKDEPDPLRHARTTRANLIERAVLAPYWVNYHCEHHMFMHLPCYSLPKAHRLLRAQGVTERMEVEPGYLQVLAMASAKPERAPVPA